MSLSFLDDKGTEVGRTTTTLGPGLDGGIPEWLRRLRERFMPPVQAQPMPIPNQQPPGHGGAPAPAPGITPIGGTGQSTWGTTGVPPSPAPMPVGIPPDHRGGGGGTTAGIGGNPASPPGGAGSFWEWLQSLLSGMGGGNWTPPNFPPGFEYDPWKQNYDSVFDIPTPGFNDLDPYPGSSAQNAPMQPSHQEMITAAGNAYPGATGFLDDGTPIFSGPQPAPGVMPAPAMVAPTATTAGSPDWYAANYPAGAMGTPMEGVSWDPATGYYDTGELKARNDLGRLTAQNYGTRMNQDGTVTAYQAVPQRDPVTGAVSSVSDPNRFSTIFAPNSRPDGETPWNPVNDLLSTGVVPGAPNQSIIGVPSVKDAWKQVLANPGDPSGMAFFDAAMAIAAGRDPTINTRQEVTDPQSVSGTFSDSSGPVPMPSGQGSLPPGTYHGGDEVPGEHIGVPLEAVADTPKGGYALVTTGNGGPSYATDYWEGGFVPLAPDGSIIPGDMEIPPGYPVRLYRMTDKEMADYMAQIGQEAPPASAESAPASAPPPGAAAPPAEQPTAAEPAETQLLKWVASNAVPGRALPIPESASAGTVLSQWPPEVTIYYYNDAGTKKIVKETNFRLQPGVQYYIEGVTASELKALQKRVGG